MKKHLLISIALLTIIFISNAQTLERLIDIPWNTKDGLQTKLTELGNYGLKEFEIIDEDHIAIFSDVSNSIKVYSFNKKQLIDTFFVDKAVRSFAYDDKSNLYYFADYSFKIHVYSPEGKCINSFNYTMVIGAIDKLIAYNGSLYATVVGQETYQLIKDGNILSENEQKKSNIDGEFINDDIFTKVKKSNESDFNFSYFKKGNSPTSITLKLSDNTYALKPILIKNSVVYFVQYEDIKKNDKIKTYFKLIIVNISNGIIINSMDIWIFQSC